MEKLLFYHGGPGLNGNPERHLLTDYYRQAGLDLHCWDEPSAQRPTGFPFSEAHAFENYQRSAEQFLLAHYAGQPVGLVLYCFSSHLIEHLLQTHPEKIKQLTLITPDFCLACSDRNIFSFAEQDFRAHGDARAEQLRQICQHYQDPSDENTMQGWQLAVENPRLFTYYWRSPAQMHAFMHYYSGAYRIDVTSFLSVRRALRTPRVTPSSVPLLVLYGRYDGIVSISHELSYLAQHFPNARVVEMPHSSHYPHIEEKEAVVALLTAALAEAAATLSVPQQPVSELVPVSDERRFR